MKSKRRAWVIVGLLAVALVAVAGPLAEPVYWWVMTKEEAYPYTRIIASTDDSHFGLADVRGVRTVKRCSPGEQHGLTRLWFLQSGLVESETWYEAGLWVRMTKGGIDRAVTKRRSQPTHLALLGFL